MTSDKCLSRFNNEPFLSVHIEDNYANFPAASLQPPVPRRLTARKSDVIVLPRIETGVAFVVHMTHAAGIRSREARSGSEVGASLVLNLLVIPITGLISIRTSG